MNFSLQLWSVHDSMKENYEETVKRVGALGYNGVEFACGYGELTSEEMNALLKESGLYAAGTHSGFDVFENSFDADLEFNHAVGSEYIVCPSAPIKTAEQVDKLIRILNTAGEKAAKYGMKVGYHNHHREFSKINGRYVMDLIADGTTDNVVLELDVFWAQYAGINPFDYIEKKGRKIELIHLKQMGWMNNNADMGDGNIDMAKIIQTAKYARHFVVEHEEYDKPVWDCIANDITFLKSIV